MVNIEKLKNQCPLLHDIQNKAQAKLQAQNSDQMTLDCGMKIAKNRRENREKKTIGVVAIATRAIVTNGLLLSLSFD